MFPPIRPSPIMPSCIAVFSSVRRECRRAGDLPDKALWLSLESRSAAGQGKRELGCRQAAARRLPCWFAANLETSPDVFLPGGFAMTTASRLLVVDLEATCWQRQPPAAHEIIEI